MRERAACKESDAAGLGVAGDCVSWSRQVSPSNSTGEVESCESGDSALVETLTGGLCFETEGRRAECETRLEGCTERAQLRREGDSEEVETTGAEVKEEGEEVETERGEVRNSEEGKEVETGTDSSDNDADLGVAGDRVSCNTGLIK